MRLVLCDDHKILADALAAALEARGHQVLAVTATPTEAVAAVAAHRPDICLLDVHFPEEENGLDAARVIRQRYPQTKVLLFSGAADSRTVSEAAKLGVAGYLLKDQSVSEISQTLEMIALGQAVSGPRLPPRIAGHSGSPAGLDALTPKEREVLAHLVAGESTGQIAQAMGVTVGTIRIYIGKVLAKLGVHSRLQAVALARKLGA
jgi:two-component system nitrate/nitrite response regulator NarL